MTMFSYISPIPLYFPSSKMQIAMEKLMNASDFLSSKP
jgi:hypothetical protein